MQSLDPGPPGLREFSRGGGPRPSLEAESRQRHAEAAEFHHHVRAPGELAQRHGPLRKHRVPLTGVASDPEDAATVIQHDGGVRKLARKTVRRGSWWNNSQASKLRFERREMSEPGAKLR